MRARALLGRGEINLVGRVEATVSRCLFTGAAVGWAGAALAQVASGLGVLGGLATAGTLAGGTGAARAAGALELVLGGGFVTVTVHGGLLAAGAGSLLGTGALDAALAATGGRLGDGHIDIGGVDDGSKR